MILFLTLLILYLIVDSYSKWYIRNIKIEGMIKSDFDILGGKVIEYSIKKMGSHNQLPKLKFIKIKEKDTLGHYIPSKNEIVVDLDKHDKLLEVLETILHEYKHYVDLYYDKSMIDYNKGLEKHGYWNHPNEIASREVSNKLKEKCFEFIVQKYMFTS